MSARERLFLGVMLVVAVIPASLLIDRWLWSSLKWQIDVGSVLPMTSAALAAALLVVSIAISVVQAAVEKWPPYIYQSIHQRQSRNDLMTIIVVGLLLALGTLLVSEGDGADGTTAALLTMLVAGWALIALADYVIEQLQLFDPTGLAHHIAKGLARTRGSLLQTKMPDNTQRLAGHQQNHLAAVDSLLGLARWSAEPGREHPQQAMEIVDLVIDEVDAQHVAAAGRATLECNQPLPMAGRRLPYKRFPGSTLPFVRTLISEQCELKTHWLEPLVGEWISRSMASITSRDAAIITGDNWVRWIDTVGRWARDAARLGQSTAPGRLLVWLGVPLLRDEFGDRPLRDRLAHAVMSLYIDLAPTVDAEALWQKQLRAVFAESEPIAGAADAFAAMTTITERLEHGDPSLDRELLVQRFEDLSQLMTANKRLEAVAAADFSAQLQLLSAHADLSVNRQRGLAQWLNRMCGVESILAAEDANLARRWRRAMAAMMTWIAHLLEKRKVNTVISTALSQAIDLTHDVAEEHVEALNSLRQRLAAA